MGIDAMKRISFHRNEIIKKNSSFSGTLSYGMIKQKHIARDLSIENGSNDHWLLCLGTSNREKYVRCAKFMEQSDLTYISRSILLHHYDI